MLQRCSVIVRRDDERPTPNGASRPGSIRQYIGVAECLLGRPLFYGPLDPGLSKTKEFNRHFNELGSRNVLRTKALRIADRVFPGLLSGTDILKLPL